MKIYFNGGIINDKLDLFYRLRRRAQGIEEWWRKEEEQKVYFVANKAYENLGAVVRAIERLKICWT